MNEPTAGRNLKIRNWRKFQHFKDRRPPWVKVYRDIMERRDINMISDRSFRLLVYLWLIASEDELKNGNLPSVDDIAFRIRWPKALTEKGLEELGPFLEQGDIAMISTGYHVDAPETETETEAEREAEAACLSAFERCWKAFGRYGAKPKALTYWRELSTEDRADIEGAIPHYLECVAAGRSKKQFEGWIDPANRLWAMDWKAAKVEAEKLGGKTVARSPSSTFDGLQVYEGGEVGQ